MCKTDKPVDWTKPIQARDGRPARLMGVLKSLDRRTHFVAFCEKDGDESWVQVSPNGRGYSTELQPYDVINVPARVSGYVNVYLHPSRGTKPYLGGSVFDTASAADQNSSQNRVARIRVDIEEGRYDE